MTQGGYPQQSPNPHAAPGYGAPRRASFGVVGGVLAVVGAIAGVIAFTATNWYSGSGDSHFSDVHDLLKIVDKANAANGLSVAYFRYLAWLLLAVGVVAALAANLPSPASSALRAIGALVGVAGIVITLLSIKLISNDAVIRQIGGESNSAPDGFSGYLKDAAKAPSLYLSLGAFLLIVIGSAMGPRRA